MLYLEEAFPWDMEDLYGKRACFPVDDYFEFYYQDSQLYEQVYEFAKRVIKEIDKSDLISPLAIGSPVLGIIPALYASSGGKATYSYVSGARPYL